MMEFELLRSFVDEKVHRGDTVSVPVSRGDGFEE
jgi:hypothetical protein